MSRQTLCTVLDILNLDDMKAEVAEYSSQIESKRDRIDMLERQKRRDEERIQQARQNANMSLVKRFSKKADQREEDIRKTRKELKRLQEELSATESRAKDKARSEMEEMGLLRELESDARSKEEV